MIPNRYYNRNKVDRQIISRENLQYYTLFNDQVLGDEYNVLFQCIMLTDLSSNYTNGTMESLKQLSSKH